MSDTSKTSRRSALLRGLLLIGGAVGVGAATGRADARPAPETVAGMRTLEFRGRGWHVSGAGRQSGQALRGGERTQTYGELLDGAGTAVGSFSAASFHLSNPFSHGDLADQSLELHSFSLPGGTILGMGSALGGQDAFAVIGGTGDYTGARGSYVARQDVRERGGDGTADITIYLSA